MADTNESYQLGEDQPKTLADFEYLRITDKTPIALPEPVLMLSGETIAVECDIFTISGASKSGKSAFASMAIAASLTSAGTIADGVSDLQMKPNPDGMAVIHFDTEQARHKQQYNVKAVIRRAGFETSPNFYLSYNIRKLPLAEYPYKTAEICEAASCEFNGIHSIWIDGGADYIAGVNDEEKANEAVKFFEELAIAYETAVFIIVHTNPGSDKERGHFGSQCQRKSGGILSIKEDATDNSSFIEPKLLRYAGKGEIPKLKFKFDKEKGYHVGTGIQIKQDPEEIKRNKLINKAFELAQAIFGGQKSYLYGAAINEIERITLKSINLNKQLFTVMLSKQMIEKGNDNHYRYNDKYIHNLQA